MQTSLIPYLAPIGRLMLSSIFLASALNKIMDWQQPSQMMADRGLPAVGALLAVAVEAADSLQGTPQQAAPLVEASAANVACCWASMPGWERLRF